MKKFLIVLLFALIALSYSRVLRKDECTEANQAGCTEEQKKAFAEAKAGLTKSNSTEAPKETEKVKEVVVGEQPKAKRVSRDDEDAVVACKEHEYSEVKEGKTVCTACKNPEDYAQGKPCDKQTPPVVEKKEGEKKEGDKKEGDKKEGDKKEGEQKEGEKKRRTARREDDDDLDSDKKDEKKGVEPKPAEQIVVPTVVKADATTNAANVTKPAEKDNKCKENEVFENGACVCPTATHEVNKEGKCVAKPAQPADKKRRMK